MNQIKMKKILKWSILVLIVLAIIFTLISYKTLINSVAPYSGKLAVNGIQNAVEITFDSLGIPQVWAKSEQDALFGMGWLHASERLFQMDMTRRVAKGRLSEMLGKLTLKYDIESRIIGHFRMAKAALSQLDLINRKRLQAYVDGVNTYVQQAKALPFEYYLLGQDFEEWTLEDCLSILSFQTWFSDALQNMDKFYVKIASELGYDKARTLQFGYPVWAPYTVDQNDNLNLTHSLQSALTKSLFQDEQIPFVLSVSSNSWATSPEKSVSGHAMFASDPHLDITRIPHFWFYSGLHIEVTNSDVLGISAAGLPFIVMGHNGKAAWAFTAGGVDVTEYYQEKIHVSDSTQYLTLDGWKKFDITREKIAVASEDSFDLEILKSIHGPVYYKNDSLKKVFTLDWAGFDADLNKAVSSGFDLLSISDFEDFRKVVTNFGALDANWTFADKKGNIGYQLGTPIPVRSSSYENLPFNGWQNDRIWQGYYPLEKTPHALNPTKGWLATANNKQVNPEIGIDVPGNFASDRIVRISKMLQQKSKYSISDFKDMQLDQVDEFLLKFKDQLTEPLMGFAEPGIVMSRKLQSWDGYTGPGSSETAFLSLFLEKFKKNIFQDELGKSYRYIKYVWVLNILQNDDETWFDNIKTPDIRESRDDIIKKTIAEALEIVGEKKWSDFQTLKMEHPFAVIPVLSSLLNLSHGPWHRYGTKGSLNASFGKFLDNHFDVKIGPSWRFIIDFANPEAIKMVIPLGNSGNPISPYYSNFLEMWQEGKYWTLPLSKENVYKKAKTIFTLNPIIQDD